MAQSRKHCPNKLTPIAAAIIASFASLALGAPPAPTEVPTGGKVAAGNAAIRHDLEASLRDRFAGHVRMAGGRRSGHRHETCRAPAAARWSEPGMANTHLDQDPRHSDPVLKKPRCPAGPSSPGIVVPRRMSLESVGRAVAQR